MDFFLHFIFFDRQHKSIRSFFENQVRACWVSNENSENSICKEFVFGSFSLYTKMFELSVYSTVGQFIIGCLMQASNHL